MNLAASRRVFALPPGPYPYTPRLPVPAPTPLDACDTAVAELRTAADRWARTDPERVLEAHVVPA